MAIDANNGPIRFGIFELDPRTRELRRNGVLVKLQDQPFQVLLALTGRPGELVTREELHKRVWPDDTFVDYEVGLSRAVNKLREALGDAAENPRFVQTLPKRGYRFIAPVETIVPAETAESTPPPVEVAVPRQVRPRWWWAALALPIASLAAVAILHFLEKSPAPRVPLQFDLKVSEKGSLPLILSPDGRMVAFVKGSRLLVRSLESGETRDLSPSAGTVPFWSPDSRFIGYKDDGMLKKVEAKGGSPQAVADLQTNVWGCGAWNHDDVIVFGDRRVGLFRVPASGGVPVQITSVDPARHENSHYCPSFLPDGRHFVYMRASTGEGKSAIYLGLVDAKPDQQSAKPLLASNSEPVYTPSEDPDTGYVLFVRGGALMAQPFDNSRLELKGQATPIAGKILDEIPGAVFVGFSASANGILTFPRFHSFAEQLTWHDREGKVLGTAGEQGRYTTLALSPDGTRVAVDKNSGKADTSNLWLLDVTRGGAATRFTFGAHVDAFPIWSPDGSRIVFASARNGPYNLYQKPANGMKEEEVLLKSSENNVATSWSRDGRYLLYTVVAPNAKPDIWLLPLEGARKPVPFLRTPFNERQAQFSPDGHWVAYTSDESGRNEIYVRSISMNSAGTVLELGGKLPVSGREGSDPRWRGDGRELYFSSPAGELLAVEITTHPAFRAGVPKSLGAWLYGYWDSTPDGKRFLSVEGAAGEPQPNTVLVNWQARLKK